MLFVITNQQNRSTEGKLNHIYYSNCQIKRQYLCLQIKFQTAAATSFSLLDTAITASLQQPVEKHHQPQLLICSVCHKQPYLDDGNKKTTDKVKAIYNHSTMEYFELHRVTKHSFELS